MEDNVPLWLATEMGSALLYFWYVSLPLTALAAAGAIWLARHRPIDLGARLAVGLLPLCPLAILIVGGFTQGDPQAHHPVAMCVIGGLLLISLCGYVAAFLKTERHDLPAAAIGALGAWLSIWAAFVSSVSISGDWL